MLLVSVVLGLALLQYLYFGFVVGAARGKYKIAAPAVTGHKYFERAYRVQQNTLEQLVIFIPALMLFASYVHGLTAAGMGVVFIIGRFLYFVAYMKDPASRGPGFIISYMATVLLLLGGMGGALWQML